MKYEHSRAEIMWHKQISLPLKLTLIRLVGSPFVLPFCLVYLLPFNLFWLNCSLAAFFLFFGLTDFLDGYFARKYHQTSTVGAMLDPIADKFLLYATLVSLVAVHKLYFFWAIVWIGREFLIMALRQIALENSFSVAVSSWGKIKTVLQIVCLAVVIANPYQAIGFDAFWWNGMELSFLIVSTGLSLISAYSYFFTFSRQLESLKKSM